MLWFLKTSYSYIHPRGFKEHVKFILDFPKVYFGYAKLMRKVGK